MGIVFILIICYWDKFYYILKGDGNNYENYFYFLKNGECPIHKNRGCHCQKFRVKNVEIQKYIGFYRYSSQLINFSNGKLKFVKKRNKNSLRFTI